MSHQEYEILEVSSFEHPRMLFFLGCISFLVGIVFGSDGLDLRTDWIIILFPIVFSVTLWIRRLSVVFITICVCLGWYTLGTHTYKNQIQSIERLWYIMANENKIYITGTVEKKLYKTELIQAYRLSIDNFDTISTDGVEAWDKLLLELPSNLTVWVWDSIGFTGKLISLYDNWIQDFARYTFFQWLSAKVTTNTYIRNTWEKTPKLSEVVNWTEKLIAQWFPRDSAGIILGMTIGNVELMGKNIQESFRKSWISHILVVSWSNITFLIVLISGLLKYLPIGKSIRIGIIMIFVLLYSALVWWDVPVMRSTLMWLLWFYAIEQWARISSLALLFLVGCGFLIFSPLSLLYDPAFWLSFAATMSIILFYNRILCFFRDYNIPSWMASIVSITLAASIGTIPITLYHFGSLSYTMVFANIAIALVVWWILLFSVLYIFLSVLGTGFLYLFGIFIYIPVQYLIYIAQYFGKYWLWEPDRSTQTIIIFCFFIAFYFEIFRMPAMILQSDQKIHDPQ